MSEKRHATLDAKSTDTYKRNKKFREEREKQKIKENRSKIASFFIIYSFLYYLQNDLFD